MMSIIFVSAPPLSFLPAFRNQMDHHYLPLSARRVKRGNENEIDRILRLSTERVFVVVVAVESGNQSRSDCRRSKTRSSKSNGK